MKRVVGVVLILFGILFPTYMIVIGISGVLIWIVGMGALFSGIGLVRG